MKKFSAFIAILMAFTFLSSCEKDEGKLPNIAFTTGTGYTTADATVAKGTTVKVGITASKSEDKDVLKTMDVTKSLDGAAATSYYTETLTGSAGDNYTHDFNITTRTVAGTEKYVFTVINRDGLKNQVSLTLTTN